MGQRGKDTRRRGRRLLRSREVILRQDGRVSYFVLTPRDQLRLAAYAIGAPLIVLAICGALAYARHAVEARPIVVAEPAQPDPHYAALAHDMRAMLEPRVSVSVQPGGSDAVWLTAALRALDAQRRASAAAIDVLQRQVRGLRTASAGLERQGARTQAGIDKVGAALRQTEAQRDAAMADSVRLAEALRASQGRLAAAGADHGALEKSQDILKAGLGAVDELAGHLAAVEQGYRARTDAVAAALDAERDTAARLVARLAQTKQQLSVAAGPRLVALARKRGVDLIDYLFPMFDLPDGDGPEPALILAVMRQESGFSHKATNPSGAVGLMQIMPDTAQQFADKLNLGYDEDKLLDPDFNLTLGRAYLDHLIRYYSGSYILALAAYNAGPTRVADWLKRFGDPRVSPDDPLTWVDALPFRETRRYVNAVMCALQVYRYRLVDPRPEPGPRPPTIRSALAGQPG